MVKRKLSNESSNEEDSDVTVVQKRTHITTDNLYLDTINRAKLDFDFEKVCCNSLSNINIYGCLVCGKYFQGRGKTSNAYFHSLDFNHRVFLNLSNLKAYLLPENLEIVSNAINDIKCLVNPTYSESQLLSLQTQHIGFDLHHKPYDIGYIGLNNINNNDYSNVILQLLLHVPLIRDYYLLDSYHEVIEKDELNAKFGLLVRKFWYDKLFKNHISPHELLQYIAIKSNKAFTIAEKSDPKLFLVWLLNNLHSNLIKNESAVKGTKTTKSILTSSLQGKLQITTHNLKSEQETVTATKFWLLTLNLPPISVFENNSSTDIPQINIQSLVEKYNGVKRTDFANDWKTYKIIKLPKYLILHIDRYDSRNPTVVKFPTTMAFDENDKKISYKLISNVTNQANIKENNLNDEASMNWNIQLENSYTSNWINVQDLEIKEIEKNLIFLSESYIQIWERM